MRPRPTEKTDTNHSASDEWLASLRDAVGAENVLVAPEALLEYSYDVWPLATKLRNQGKQPYAPDVVVRATNVDQIQTLLRWATETCVPVTPWGRGSSVTGAPLPSRGGVTLDMSPMDRILALEPESLLVQVEAGILGWTLEQELNARGYTLNHSPQSLDRSTPGGWVATRATGQFSSRYGGIEDLVVAFEAVLPTGERVETEWAPRAAVGPDLRHLFMGAEGTMGVVTSVTMKIFPQAPYRRLQAVAIDSVPAGIAVMRQMMRLGLRPFLVRFYDVDEARHAMHDPDFEHCVMFFGVEGLQAVADAEYEAIVSLCRQEGGRLLGPEPTEAWMQRRYDFSPIENLLQEPGGYAETIEVSHFWHGIGETYKLLKTRLAPYADEVLGHFSHAYPQGTSLYIILLGHAKDEHTAEERIRSIWQVAMETALESGAAISHHHGIGLARSPYVSQDLGAGFLLLQRLKHALDPAGIMNPGKLGLDRGGETP